jgi:single-stranded-DNA-specific exonuclease
VCSSDLSIEKTMKEQALAALEHLNLKGKNLPMGLCLFDESWHQGVIGILAGRIKDEYHRPVIAFASANDNELKGSARSIPGLHIRDLLDEIATKHPELMTKFGGHAMAAGLTLNKDKLSEFAKAFDATVKQHISEENLMGEVLSDGELTSLDLSLELAEHLRIGGPWGQHFPEPLFDGKFKVVQQRLLGGAHLKLTLSLPEQPYQWLDAIAFNVDDTAWPNPQCQYIHATYRLDVNEYQDTRKLQLIVEHFEPYHNEVL